MPLLSGPEVDGVINRAEQVCLNAYAYALDNLRAVADNLNAYGEAGRLYVDLTEIHNLGYYTGITFEALTPELGFAVAAMVVATITRRFFRSRSTRCRCGPPANGCCSPAVAWEARLSTHPASPDVLFGTTPESGSLKSLMPIIQDWRSRRLSVAIDVDGLADDALLELGRVTGAQYCIRWTDEGAVVTAMNQTASASRFVPASQMDQLATEILNAISSAD